jgi:hypothetical protein
VKEQKIFYVIFFFEGEKLDIVLCVIEMVLIFSDRSCAYLTEIKQTVTHCIWKLPTYTLYTTQKAMPRIFIAYFHKMYNELSRVISCTWHAHIHSAFGVILGRYLHLFKLAGAMGRTRKFKFRSPLRYEGVKAMLEARANMSGDVWRCLQHHALDGHKNE